MFDLFSDGNGFSSNFSQPIPPSRCKQVRHGGYVVSAWMVQCPKLSADDTDVVGTHDVFFVSFEA